MAHETTTGRHDMTNATITTTDTLATVIYPDGSQVSLPAQVPGVAMSTYEAILNALDYYSATDIRDFIHECITEADDVNATPAQVAYHVVAWMAGAGDWLE